MFPCANMQTKQRDPAQLVTVLTFMGGGTFTIPSSVVQAGDFALIMASGGSPSPTGGAASWSTIANNGATAVLQAGDIGVTLTAAGTSNPCVLAIFRGPTSAAVRSSQIDVATTTVTLTGYTPASNTKGALALTTSTASSSASITPPSGWTTSSNADAGTTSQAEVNRYPALYTGGNVAIANPAPTTIRAYLVELLG